MSETPNLDTLRSAAIPSSIFFDPLIGSQDATLLEAAIDTAASAKALRDAFSRVAAEDHLIGNTPLFMARTGYNKYNTAASDARVAELTTAAAVREALRTLEAAERHLEDAKQRAEEAIAAANHARKSAQNARALAFYYQAELHNAKKEIRNPGETQYPNVHFVISGGKDLTNGDAMGFLMTYGMDIWVDRGQQDDLHVGVTLHKGVDVLEMFKELVACFPNAMPHS